MKREETLRDFTVSETGHITSSGKYEGEMLYVPHFHVQDFGPSEEFSLSQDGVDWYGVYDVTADDVTEYPELDGVIGLILHEDNDGFVFCTTYGNPAKLRRAVERIATMEEKMFADGD
ncbi:MAG: hypothetical protein M1378_05805 [Bacteroidetes bacterium]|nr:hypothetical protein [Bacteroidota bacterium]